MTGWVWALVLAVGVVATNGATAQTPDQRQQTEERSAYRDQLRRDLQSREALLRQQEQRLGELTKRLAEAHAALLPRPDGAAADQSDTDTDTSAPSGGQRRGGGGGGGGGGERSAQLERLTYEVNVARSEINLTRQQIEILKGLIARVR
ncbi:MAG: hypothetical protein SF002_12600 [Alphaproteobacteria bacterium]|nr:hypothetical protein [Alphaproteobacteria bacterium]